MKKISIITMALCLALTYTFNAMAMDEHQEHSAAASSGRSGDNIQNSMVDGLHFAYHLIDMKAKMKALNMTMPGMKSHHLMVYVGPHGGAQITDAKVGYVVSGPDGKQKVMAMAMGSGYGADIDLKKGEEVTIKVKFMTSDKKLMDEFSYTLK